MSRSRTGKFYFTFMYRPRNRGGWLWREFRLLTFSALPSAACGPQGHFRSLLNPGLRGEGRKAVPCHRKASASQAQKWHLSPPPGSPRSEGAGLSVQLRLRGEKERSGMEIPNLRYTKLFTFYIFLDCSKFPNETLASIFIVIKKKNYSRFSFKE